MTISSNAACSELLRRAGPASSHLRSVIFCRSIPPRPIDTWHTSAQTRPRLTWIYGSERDVDRASLRQPHHRANARDRHQAPAHLIIPDDGQQAAVLDDELLA